MSRYSWIIFCLAYVFGLLTTGLFYFSNDTIFYLALIKAGCIVFVLCGIGKKILSEFYIENKVWFCAILIAISAIVYFNLRIPQPKIDDVSYLLNSERSKIAIIKGKVLSEPRLNSNNKLRFWLKAEEAQIKDNKTSQLVSGKIYVTLPLLQGNEINPNQRLTLEGALYKPKKANNAAEFDFRKYLEEYGSFSGFTGWKIIDKSPANWGWYLIKNRIVRTQVKGLGSPLGQLVSSMVLGRRAVDLPKDIRDLFVNSGLAHVLAASGFHVSLLLGIVLKLTSFLDSKKQFIIGVSILLFYVFLTGFSPSVMRASLMGIAILIALANKAKVRPLGSLLLVGTILLLINPLWIWNLGFQLSFLATFGILVTLPTLNKKLDWLPSNLANAIAIPLAASIWVLPLISYQFNTVATYSIFVNLIATPLITIISIGGMLTSAISLVFPFIGMYLAWLLKYPLLLLIAITRFFTSLPGSRFAVGEISLWLLLLIYSLFIFIWLNKRIQKYWIIAILLAIGLVIFPLHYQRANLSQITILDSANRLSIVIQDRGRVILFNNQDAKAIAYKIMPFLAKQGINQIDYFIVNARQTQNYRATLSQLQSQIEVAKIIIYGDANLAKLETNFKIPLEVNSVLKTSSFTLNRINNSEALQLQTPNSKWILTDRLSDSDFTTDGDRDVLLWLDKKIDRELLQNFNCRVAIATSLTNKFDSPAIKSDEFTQVYATNDRGTITWTVKGGFSTATNNAKRNNISQSITSQSAQILVE